MSTQRCLKTSQALLSAALSLCLCESRLLNNEAGNYVTVYDDTGVWSWAEALAHCELVYGTSLASIHSDSDEYLSGLSRYNHEVESWIGLTDQNTEGQWEWIDGTPYDYNVTWSPGEPNDQNNEDCGQFLTTNASKARATANDIPCSWGYHQFICNAPSESDTVTQVTTEGDDEGLIAGLIVVSVLLGLCCFGVLSAVAFYFFYNKKMEALSKDGKGAAMFQILNPDTSEQADDAAGASEKSVPSVVSVEPTDTEN